MKWKYKCEVCGCHLDPGEGRICEDCREERESRNCATSKGGILNFSHRGQIDNGK